METYTIFRIVTLPDGAAEVTMETNDDDDDGYPDGKVTFGGPWKFRGPDGLEAAYGMTGRSSHRGFYGQPVDVYLDGKKLFEKGALTK